MVDSISLSPSPRFSSERPPPTDHEVRSQPVTKNVAINVAKNVVIKPKNPRFTKEKTGKYIKKLQTDKHELTSKNDELKQDYSSLLDDMTACKKVNDELSEENIILRESKKGYKTDYQKQVELNSDLLQEIESGSSKKSTDGRKYKELYSSERRKRKALEAKVSDRNF